MVSKKNNITQANVINKSNFPPAKLPNYRSKNSKVIVEKLNYVITIYLNRRKKKEKNGKYSGWD